MSQSQTQNEPTFNDKNLCSLNKSLDLLHFRDKKTRQLYKILANSQNSSVNEDQMKEVAQSTILNSQFHISRHRQFKKIKNEQAYVIKGVTLCENKGEEFNKDRRYSIIKTKRQRKDPISASDFQKISPQNEETKYIVYQYDKQHYMRGIEQQAQPLTISSKKMDASTKTSRNARQSRLSTIQNHGLLSRYAKQYCDKLNKYQFTKVKKTLKIYQPKNQSCNGFNCLDSCFNKQGYEQVSQGCFCQNMQAVSKPIKYRK